MGEIKLGDKVRDLVSGLIGIAVSEIRYLSRCHQFGVQAPFESGKMPSIEYIDVAQLSIVQVQAVVIGEEDKVEVDPGGAQSYAPSK